MNSEDIRCPQGTYHFYSNVLDCEYAIRDRCRRCGHEIDFLKKAGKIDERYYLLTHVRDFCQPEGATANIFREIHGDKAVEEGRRLAEKYRDRTDENLEQGKAEAKEALKIWKRLSSKGLTEKEILKQVQESKL